MTPFPRFDTAIRLSSISLFRQTMPPEPTPPMMGLSGPVPVARSRSDFVKIRPPARLPPPQGGSGTRPEQPRPPSIGYALSTNELSATLESDMNLNYVGFPVKKASTFLETPRSTLGGLERLDHLDRVVARRRENGKSVSLFYIFFGVTHRAMLYCAESYKILLASICFSKSGSMTT